MTEMDAQPGMAAQVDALVRRFAGFAVISCDIFDTAVMRRLARPEDVLLAVGLRLRARGLVACEAAALREYRLEAERAVREAAALEGRDEPRIGEVYARLAACGIVNDPEAAALEEFATERAVCRPVEAVRMALARREAGQRLVFVSDSILPGAWLAELLRDCGYGEGCEVFASSDVGRSKHGGGMFAAVMQAVGCAAGGMLHIGDNRVSDIARAAGHGIATVHLPWSPPPPERDDVAAQDAVVRLAHSYRRARGGGRPGSALGRYFSVLLIGFSLFILAAARRRGIRRIFFLARDGYLPLDIVRRLVARHEGEFELGYLHVSRQSVVVPAMEHRVAQLADDMAGSMQGQKLETALEFLGVDAGRTGAMLRELGLDPEQELKGREPVQRLFAAQGTLVAERLASVSAAARAYLAKAGFAAPGKRLVVDVGWRGSLQVALGELAGLPAADVAGAYIGLWPQALRPELDPRQAAGYLFAFGHPRPLMDKVREGYILLELLFSAPHGTVLGYTDAGEPVHAVEAEPGASARLGALAALEADCVGEFVALDEMLDGAWPEEIDAASALFDMAGLLTRPSRAEVAMVNAIPFIHGLNGRHTAAAVNVMPLHEYVLNPRGVVRRLGNAPWRSGAVRAALPWPLPGMDYATFRDRMERVLRWLRLDR
jgi:FMN phosphatase YigB (HAD superfamily)